MKEYTVTQATIDVMSEWKKGKQYHGTDLHNMVLDKLKQHNSPHRPMDATTMRIMRYRFKDYGIELVNRTTSLYVKN